jgi:hypothetical protein
VSELIAFRDRYDDSLIELALDRLDHDDVRETRHGFRVALRPDLGDNRVEAEAYWPMHDGGCSCYSAKSRGVCSHRLAVEIFVTRRRHALDNIFRCAWEM